MFLAIFPRSIPYSIGFTTLPYGWMWPPPHRLPRLIGTTRCLARCFNRTPSPGGNLSETHGVLPHISDASSSNPTDHKVEKFCQIFVGKINCNVGNTMIINFKQITMITYGGGPKMGVPLFFKKLD